MKRETVQFDSDKIEAVRKAKMFSPYDLAKACKRTPKTIYRALDGFPVSMSTARLICYCLDVTRDEVCKP